MLVTKQSPVLPAVVARAVGWKPAMQHGILAGDVADGLSAPNGFAGGGRGGGFACEAQEGKDQGKAEDGG